MKLNPFRSRAAGINVSQNLMEAVEDVRQSLYSMREVPRAVWDEIELELTGATKILFEEISSRPLNPKYRAWKEAAVRNRLKVNYGAGGQKARAQFTEAGKLTGKLHEIATRERVRRGYNLARFFDFGGTRRGTYVFGINTQAFWHEYPKQLFEKNNYHFLPVLEDHSDLHAHLANRLWTLWWGTKAERELKARGFK